MARNYVVFMGRTARRFKPCRDDGTLILWAGDLQPLCSCGKGHMIWAEAGYVPWHRICDACGSHWDLHPVVWGPMIPSEGYLLAVGNGHKPAAEYTRWVDGPGEIPLNKSEPLGQSGKTWGDLLAIITPEQWESARENHRLNKWRYAGSIVVPCAWARRARFHITSR